MAQRDLGVERTFDILASARNTNARQVRRRVAPLAIGAAVVAAGIVVGGRLGSGIAVCGLYLLSRAIKPKEVRRWLRGAQGRIDDQVDQASWESFPASDPPAFSPANAR